jgi:hypothetical protein
MAAVSPGRRTPSGSSISVLSDKAMTKKCAAWSEHLRDGPERKEPFWRWWPTVRRRLQHTASILSESANLWCASHYNAENSLSVIAIGDDVHREYYPFRQEEVMSEIVSSGKAIPQGRRKFNLTNEQIFRL